MTTLPTEPAGVEIAHGLSHTTRQAIADVLRSVAEADARAPIGDDTWGDLLSGNLSAGTAVLARNPHSTALLGAAVMDFTPDSGSLNMAIRPEARWTSLDVEGQLLRCGVGEGQRRGIHRLRWWCSAPGPEADRLAEASGFAGERDLLQLQIGLPLPRDPQLRGEDAVTRSFAVGVDEDPWLAVNNRAFDGHPEQGNWELGDLLKREAEPWFDPHGFLLHEIEGQLAAFCWTKIHHHEAPVLGEIYVIGVDPAFQGLGLGRALTVAGLDHIASVGVTHGMLYVDSVNGAAVRLYESLGFVLHHLDRAYVAELGSAKS